MSRSEEEEAAAHRRVRAEEVVRQIEDFVDTLITARMNDLMDVRVSAAVAAEHRENLTQSIEGMLP